MSDQLGLTALPVLGNLFDARRFSGASDEIGAWDTRVMFARTLWLYGRSGRCGLFFPNITRMKMRGVAGLRIPDLTLFRQWNK
jgi:hypothetical protein